MEATKTLFHSSNLRGITLLKDFLLATAISYLLIILSKENNSYVYSLSPTKKLFLKRKKFKPNCNIQNLILNTFSFINHPFKRKCIFLREKQQKRKKQKNLGDLFLFTSWHFLHTAFFQPGAKRAPGEDQNSFHSQICFLAWHANQEK